MPTTAHLPFAALNSKDPIPQPSDTTFTLTPTPSQPTDIWRKPGPPTIKTFNAPIFYKSIPLSSFLRVRVTVSAPWTTLYDQGGLAFILKDPSPSSATEAADQKWIKTGVEFYQNEAYVSTVVADRWADWSLVQTGFKKGGTEVTLEIERNEHEGTLWVYVVDGEKKVPVREVTWILSEPGETEVLVGVYAATPYPVGKKGLEVNFEGWELEIK